MKRTKYLATATLSVLLFMSGVLQASGFPGPGERMRTISVTGEASVRVEPDRVSVAFSVVSRADSPDAARERNEQASAGALNRVRELGIEERRIRMETLRLQPRREYDPETRQHRDAGYEATRQMVVELDELALLPDLIAGMVQQGANRLRSVRYGLRDRGVPRNEALREALTDARDKARFMAGALDVEVGDVVRIRERNLDLSRPVVRAEAMTLDQGDARGDAEAYATGEIEISAEVQVVFELR